MKKAKEIRTSNVLKMNKNIFTVMKAVHFNPSEKACVMKLKLRNIITGQVVNEVIEASSAVDDLRLDSSEMQFLFKSGDDYTFMDTENYEQIEINKDLIGDSHIYLQEEMIITVKFYEEKPVIVELPANIVVEIEYTENVEGGNTTGNVVKDATIPNGEVIKVPAFIKIGEKVKIDTETGQYISRA